MGLPGSGKTTLANELAPLLDAKRLNADEVRKKANDWDFSIDGRERQAKRMANLAKKQIGNKNYILVDFICPTTETRNLFAADFTVWMNTIKEGRFNDTNKIFTNPKEYDCQVTTKDAKYWSAKILKLLNI